MKTLPIWKIKRWGLVLVVALALIPAFAAARDKAALNEQLMQAAGRGDLVLVKRLLGEGAPVDAKNERHVTALTMAADSGHLDMVDLLVRNGADVEAAGDGGGPPLLEAARGGHRDVVRLLIEKGANVNGRSRGGFTPLMAAAGGTRGRVETSHLHIAEFLVRKGANVNARSDCGDTALLSAAYAKDGIKMVRLLLDGGADPNAKDEKGLTALLQAVSGFNHLEGLELVELLLDKGADVNARALDGNTVLLEAAASDDSLDRRKWYEVVWARLRYQLWGYEWGPTYPLGARSPEVVKLLLERGADVKAKDRYGWSALQRAQGRGNTEIVELIKKYEANNERARPR